jgi:hypothetical protein
MVDIAGSPLYEPYTNLCDSDNNPIVKVMKVGQELNEGRYIWVIDKNERIHYVYVGENSGWTRRKTFKVCGDNPMVETRIIHPCLASDDMGDGDIYSAGEFVTSDTTVTIDNISGHYCPSYESLKWALTIFKNHLNNYSVDIDRDRVLHTLRHGVMTEGTVCASHSPAPRRTRRVRFHLPVPEPVQKFIGLDFDKTYIVSNRIGYVIFYVDEIEGTYSQYQKYHINILESTYSLIIKGLTYILEQTVRAEDYNPRTCRTLDLGTRPHEFCKNDGVEIYSNSQRKWVPGEVKQIIDNDIVVSYYNRGIEYEKRVSPCIIVVNPEDREEILFGKPTELR